MSIQWLHAPHWGIASHCHHRIISVEETVKWKLTAFTVTIFLLYLILSIVTNLQFFLVFTSCNMTNWRHCHKYSLVSYDLSPLYFLVYLHLFILLLLVLIFMPNCTSSGFQGILLYGLPCLLPVYCLVRLGPPCVSILLLASLNMIQQIVMSLDVIIIY